MPPTVGERTPRNNKIVEEAELPELNKDISTQKIKTPVVTPRSSFGKLALSRMASQTENLNKRPPNRNHQISSEMDEIKTPVSQSGSRNKNAAKKLKEEEPISKRKSKKISGSRVAAKLDEDDEDDEEELEEKILEKMKKMDPRSQALIHTMLILFRSEDLKPSDIEIFTSVELDLLQSIVKRKYKINIPSKDLEDKKKLLVVLNNLNKNSKAEKRSEENNKLVFKRALKYLISTYKIFHADEVKDKKKKQYEGLICKKYFGDIPIPEPKKKAKDNKTSTKRAQNQAKTLEDKLRQFVINPNTINAKYIRFVFKSTSFKSFFEDFVKNHFINDYGRSRPSKILKIVDTIYTEYADKKAKPFKRDAAKKYIEQNAKFKLPWSDTELEICIKSTQEFIQRVFKREAKKGSK